VEWSLVVCGRSTSPKISATVVLWEDLVIVIGHVSCHGSCVGTARGLLEVHMALLLCFVEF